MFQTEVSDLAHDPEKTIKACTIGSDTETNQCKKIMMSTNSNKLYTPRYGICYIYNFEKFDSSDDLDSVTSPGSDFGLRLTFDIGISPYIYRGIETWI